jgi:hypothetical protein
MVIVSIDHTFPPSDDTSPVYVVPPDVAKVEPKVVSAAARVIFVFLYVWTEMVPAQPSSHSVPVPHLFWWHQYQPCLCCARTQDNIPRHWTRVVRECGQLGTGDGIRDVSSIVNPGFGKLLFCTVRSLLCPS